MDINKNQQTNTFLKGMDTDTSDILIESSKYRFAENVRITTDKDGSNGEIHMIDGTDQIQISDNPAFDGEKVLALTSIRDLCVAILYKPGEPDTWRIVKWQKGSTNFVNVFGPSEERIWELETQVIEREVEGATTTETISIPIFKKLSTVLRWESDKNIKLYIADGIHEIMSINVYSNIYSVLNHPQELHQEDVFKKAFTYNASDLPTLTASISDSTGQLKPAMVQYCYRLYLQNGAASDISPLTAPIYLYKNAYQGYDTVENSDKAIDLSITNINTTGDIYIQIYRITYVQNGKQPVVELIIDQKFVGNLQITDVGNSIEDVSNAEFLSNIQTRLIPKIIESKGDILYLANVKDSVADTITGFGDFDARSYSTGNTYNGNSIFSQTNGQYSANNINFDNFSDLSKLGHNQFDGQHIDWDYDNWKEIYPNIINISGNDTNNGYYDNEHCILATNIQSALNDDIELNVEFDSSYTSSIAYLYVICDYDVVESANEENVLQHQTNQLIGSHGISSSYNITPIIKDKVRSFIQEQDSIGSRYSESLQTYYKIKNIQLKGIWIGSFDSQNIYYTIKNNSEEWYNGIGKYIKWKYVKTQDINPKYRSGEVYRFGIVLYDSAGRQSPVKWIADIQMPDYYKGLLQPSSLQNDPEIYYNYHIGLQFFVDIPSDMGVSGYDIVRCQREEKDKYTLFQGIVGATHKIYRDPYSFNPGFFTLDDVEINDSATVLDLQDNQYSQYEWHITQGGYTLIKDDKLLMFACPEYCYNKTQVQDILKNKSNVISLQVVDRRDVNSYYKEEDESFSGFKVLAAIGDMYNGYTRITSKLIDDSDKWVHSPVPYNYADYGNRSYQSVYDQSNSYPSTNNGDRNLLNAGLGFKEYTKTENGNPVKALKITAGFINLQSRARVNWGDLVDSYNIPQAQYSNEHKNVIFFNWFGQLNNPYDEEIYWHRNQRNLFESKKYSSISEIGFVTSRDHDQFIKNGSLNVFDQITSVGNNSFINWSLGQLGKNITEEYQDGEPIINWLYRNWRTDQAEGDNFFPQAYSYYDYQQVSNWYDNLQWYPIGGGDDLILFLLSSENINRYNIEDAINPTSPRIYIANVKQTAEPYNGYNETAILNSKYYSVGNHTKLPESNDSIIRTNIILTGGDTFFGHFKYNALHWWHNSIFNKQLNKMATIYDVAIESDVNLRATFGTLFRNGVGYTDGEYKIQNKKIEGDVDGYVQEHDSYRYNSGYSCSTNIIPRISDNSTAGETNIYDTRIFYSSEKKNNETIDSWLDIKQNNFLDVDTRFGELTDLKLFKDKLLFWQNNAAGIISTNERTLIQSMDDAQIILGDGSVLQRFDYITQIYGQKPNQYISCATNNSLYWWDEERREILQYTDGFSVVPLGLTKTVRNYLTHEEPAVWPSISYDVDHNELICKVLNEDESIVYNDAIQQFTAVYKFSPLFYTICDNLLYMIGNNNNQDCLYTYGTSNDMHGVTLFDNPVYPKVKFVVNNASDITKTFDIQTFGGRFYGGGYNDSLHERNTTRLTPLKFIYTTPLKQKGIANGNEVVTNQEYDFRLTIPRAGQDDNGNWKTADWGDRLRGKIMQVEISSSSNNSDFSLHYVTTKYRISWN